MNITIEPPIIFLKREEGFVGLVQTKDNNFSPEKFFELCVVNLKRFLELQKIR